MPPLYSWSCQTCDTGVEVLRSFSDYQTPPEECPKCGEYGSQQFRRVIGTTTFQLAGPRWARDGYGD